MGGSRSKEDREVVSIVKVHRTDQGKSRQGEGEQRERDQGMKRIGFTC